MKKYIISAIVAIILPLSLIAQDITWNVKAVPRFGTELDVNAHFEDGTILPVLAILKDGDRHFMDVKVIKDGVSIAVKVISCDQMYSPVKAITEDGKIIEIFAENNAGEKYEVKGVSRSGNTINLAAFVSEEKFIPLKAVSPEGITRDVAGVKFLLDNVEMEINGVKVLAHIKAIPTLEIKNVDSKWAISATNAEGDILDIVAITDKGKELPVKAIMKGNSAHLMDVKVMSSLEVAVKLMKIDEDYFVKAIDEFGRIYEVSAKDNKGNFYPVIGGEKRGNVIPILVEMNDGNKYPVKAISSAGDVFEVKGLKAIDNDVEGIISGWDVWIRYYAHIKALAPINGTKLEN